MTKLPIVRLYTDGGARGNPGPAAIGIVVCDGNNRVVKKFGEYIGQTTNNQAEYKALVRGLEIAANYTDGDVICTLDSELVVRQMTGRYRVKDGTMRKLVNEVMGRARRFRRVEYVHRPRMTGHLAAADSQVNVVLDQVQSSSIDDILLSSITKEVEIGSYEEPKDDLIDPRTVGDAFVDFCLMQGWIVREGKGRTAGYRVTERGRKELRAFGISL